MSQWEKVALTRWGTYISRIERQMLARAARQRPAPGAVFDFGCGEGRWSGLLGRVGWDLHCGDVDGIALSKCAARNQGARCVPLARDGHCIPANDASMDLVLSIEVPGVLESDWFRREAHRVLKPGGMLVGLFHNRTSARGGFRAFADRRRKQYCFYQMGYRHWSSLMGDDGLRVVYAEGLCWFPFGRASSSALIRPCIGLEKLLGLRALPSLSPWVCFIAAKASEDEAAVLRKSFRNAPIPVDFLPREDSASVAQKQEER